jgi:hypothetical protein
VKGGFQPCRIFFGISPVILANVFDIIQVIRCGLTFKASESILGWDTGNRLI